MSSRSEKLNSNILPNVQSLHSDGVEDSVSNEYLAVGINRKIINGHKLFSSASIRLDNKNLTKMYRETVSPNEQLIKDKDVLQAVEGIVFFKQALLCRSQTRNGLEDIPSHKGNHSRLASKTPCRPTSSSADTSLSGQNSSQSTGIQLDQMEAMEIQMKRRLMDLKKRYLQKQSELNKLQSKSRKRKHGKSGTNSKSKEKNSHALVEMAGPPLEPNSDNLPHVASVLPTSKDAVSDTQSAVSSSPTDDDCHSSGRKKRKLNKPKKLKTPSQSSENQSSEPDEDRPNGDVHHALNSGQSSCELRTQDLVDGLRILVKNEDGLLSAGKLKPIHPPDIYGVFVDGDRHRNRPNVLCQDEVLRNCVPDQKVASTLSVGTRVAAYWSERMHCLYPGYVISEPESDNVHIDFDDGDSAVIHVKNIRLLPTNFISANDKRGKSATPSSERRLSVDAPLKSRLRLLPDKGIGQTAVKKSEDKCWIWSGPCIDSDECNGVTKKMFYNAVTRDNVVVSCGDCAVFLSSGRPRLPYVGLVESMWESWAKTMVVRVRWFYHPEEIAVSRRKQHKKVNALYKSTHIDENDVQTISHPCYVLSREEYKKKKRNANGKLNYYYYCAGVYDPSNGQIIKEFNDNES